MTSRLVVLALTLSVGCKTAATSVDPPDALASPQASAVPAPLANVPTSVASATAVSVGADAGPPPQAVRGDQALPPDTLSRDLAGYTLQAVLMPGELPPPAKVGELSLAGLDAARKKTEPRLTIDVAPARVRIIFATGGFVLPEDSELRARSDRYGHVLTLPNAAGYRIAAPGALRALVGERRLDVAPLSAAEVVPQGEGQPSPPRRLGYRVRRVGVSTRAAHASFEIARVADAGEGGVLICRALLDLMNAPPSTALCGADEVPLHAELRWTTRGSITFDAISIVRRLDLSPQQLSVPPSGPFLMGALPARAAELLLSPAELAAMRTGPSAVVEPGARQGNDTHASLTLVNSTDELRLAWIDGVPAAWVAPGGRAETSALFRGRYSIAWRTFLGDAMDLPRVTTLPAVSEAGALDGGAP